MRVIGDWIDNRLQLIIPQVKKSGCLKHRHSYRPFRSFFHTSNRHGHGDNSRGPGSLLRAISHLLSRVSRNYATRRLCKHIKQDILCEIGGHTGTLIYMGRRLTRDRIGNIVGKLTLAFPNGNRMRSRFVASSGGVHFWNVTIRPKVDPGPQMPRRRQASCTIWL